MTAPLTVIVCGTPESAPGWWSPDMEMGPLEAAWTDAMCNEQERAWLELQAGEDRAARLLDGSCDHCQETSTLPLVEVAGEAICAGCLEGLGLDYNEAVDTCRAPGDREIDTQVIRA